MLVLLTAIRWIIGTVDVEFVLLGTRVDAQVELSACAWFAGARNYCVLFVGLQLDAHGDFVKYFRCRLFHRLRYSILHKAIVTCRKLE